MENLEELGIDDALHQKRHKEVITAINKLSNAISQNRNTEVVAAIEKNTSILKNTLSDFVTAIKSIKPSEVNINQSEVIIALNKLASDLKDSIEGQSSILASKERKKWNFKINKNNYGYIESVTAESN